MEDCFYWMPGQARHDKRVHMTTNPELLYRQIIMGYFEKYLSVWVLLCMVTGTALGYLLPAAFQLLGGLEFAHINLPVAVLVWCMIIPMLIKIDLKALSGTRQYARGIGVTLLVNWAIKPFSMALLGWLFIGHLFRPWLPADQIESYIAGLIILAAAPCTAMVFVWSNLTEGEPHFTLTQVALNDVIMVFAFAPVVGLLLGLSAISVPWQTLLLSVLVYIVIPLVIANLLRRSVLGIHGDQTALQGLINKSGPWSLTSLLLTLVLLFGFQGTQIVNNPLIIVLLSVPILIQVIFNASAAYLLNRAVGSPHRVAAPSALIGASNFFELAVATAIVLFGFESGAALATVVGVLVEVPVMLATVGVVNRTKQWYEAGLARSH
jgi:ACR3 family arsenite transporter